MEYSTALHGMPEHDRFVQEFKTRLLVHDVTCEDRLPDLTDPLWMQRIAIQREACLKTRDSLRSGVDSQSHRFPVVLIRSVLNGLIGRRARCAAVADFSDVMQTELRQGQTSRRGKPDVVNRKDAAAVLKCEDKGAPYGALEPGGMMVRRVVITNRDRKSTRLNSSHRTISYAVFCLKKKKNKYIK